MNDGMQDPVLTFTKAAATRNQPTRLEGMTRQDRPERRERHQRRSAARFVRFLTPRLSSPSSGL